MRLARTRYDHAAGSVAVFVHDRLLDFDWIELMADDGDHAYNLTLAGAKALQSLGIDIEAIRAQRRRFAFACLDRSERRPHLGGALGAALLKFLLTRKWLSRDQDSRALCITRLGRREMRARFGLDS